MRWEGSGNTRRLVKKTLCPGDYGFQKAYSYSYSQYNKNRVCNTYDRGLEKYVTPAHIDQTTDIAGGSAIDRRAARRSSSVCNHMYRKSGCDGCLPCTQPEVCKSCTQAVIGDPPGTLPVAGNVMTGGTSGAVGTVIEALGSTSNMYLRIQLRDCERGFIAGENLTFSGGTFASSDAGPIIAAECTEPPAAVKGKNSITVYKPSNKKFSVQGAVSGSSRLERLKLDTIKSANSKCRKKDARCETRGICGEKYGKGPYFAGKPRFTGWMFNSCHPETVCMNKTRQQPFGIPQLTKRGRQVRSNRLHGVDPTVKSKGKGLLPRGQYNRRAPGCKCPKVAGECVNQCCPCCTVLRQYGHVSESAPATATCGTVFQLTVGPFDEDEVGFSRDGLGPPIGDLQPREYDGRKILLLSTLVDNPDNGTWFQIQFSGTTVPDFNKLTIVGMGVNSTFQRVNADVSEHAPALRWCYPSGAAVNTSAYLGCPVTPGFSLPGTYTLTIS